MRMDKLTSRFQQALADAQSLAVGRDHQFIEPAHVLLALIDSQGGTVRPLLAKTGADVNRLRAGLGALLDRLPKVEGTPGEVHVSNDLNRLFNVTDKLAQQRGDQFIASELFVLAAFEDRALGKLLEESGVVRGALAKAIEEVRGGEKVEDANAEESRQALEKFTVDLTARASSGKLDPAAVAAFSPNARGRWQCDLYALACQRLAALGVLRMYGGSWCTYADSARFFSFRRDGRCGRMAALIWRS